MLDKGVFKIKIITSKRTGHRDLSGLHAYMKTEDQTKAVSSVVPCSALTDNNNNQNQKVIIHS